MILAPISRTAFGLLDEDRMDEESSQDKRSDSVERVMAFPWMSIYGKRKDDEMDLPL